jgi:CDP-diacylglycerol--serine O-phosphatidyltransferase
MGRFKVRLALHPKPLAEISFELMKHLVPSAFSCLNAACGAVALVLLATGLAYTEAFALLCLALAFDGLDGWAARKLNAQSRWGAWLDSACDGVSFGLAPAYGLWLLAGPDGVWWKIAALWWLGACWYRLIRFSLLRQEAVPSWFRGLPAPLAGVALSACLCGGHSISIALLAVALPAWMVSNLPFPRFTLERVALPPGVAHGHQ